ncbi:MAG TPA: redoxin domain-containing protein [Chloroflexi bacterium]|nr:redoxin domain-containing protein [Chloroflexota bacterium]
MDEKLLDPKTVRMPEFAPGEWLNTEQPLSRERLRGQVLLVDFWDYTCINCIRTLPYVTTWHARYADKGLTVIGVHAPEFRFARDRSQIEAAIARYGIRYPVLLDNEYRTWDRFANRAWPTKYLIDAEGYIRYRQQGEGFYQETERAIQAALRLRDPGVSLPEVLPPLREEDAPGAVCYRTTPELYTGYQRGALGNPEGYAAGSPLVYRMPLHFDRREPYFYAEGIWRAEREAFIFAGQEEGRLIIPYSAVGVNAVFSPSADPVEVLLNLRPSETLPVIEVRQDGEPLTPLNAGADIEYDDGGVSVVYVTRPRLYELVRNPDYESHEVELIFRAGGLAVYSFTFTSCVAPEE